MHVSSLIPLSNLLSVLLGCSYLCIDSCVFCLAMQTVHFVHISYNQCCKIVSHFNNFIVIMSFGTEKYFSSQLSVQVRWNSTGGNWSCYRLCNVVLFLLWKEMSTGTSLITSCLLRDTAEGTQSTRCLTTNIMLRLILTVSAPAGNGHLLISFGTL